jgi:hypothetical protein
VKSLKFAEQKPISCAEKWTVNWPQPSHVTDCTMYEGAETKLNLHYFLSNKEFGRKRKLSDRLNGGIARIQDIFGSNLGCV